MKTYTKELVERKYVEDTNELFDDVELATPSNVNTKTKDIIQSNVPSMLSPEWHDYAMTLFNETEMIDGHPLVAGLRRVAEVVLGPIVFSGPTQVFPVQREDHHGRATVIFTVKFANGMEYAEVADSWEGNTDDMFCAFAVAIASTRAEARALRKALKIRGVAAEELTKKDTAKIVRDISTTKKASEGEYDENGRMSDAQLNFIDVKCKQLNLDGKKLFNTFNVDNINKVSKKVASEVIDKLNEFQRDKSLILDVLIGYKQEWRDQ